MPSAYIAQQGNDATFDRFKPLNEGVKYVDPLRLQLQAKKEQKGKNVVDAPFKAASPMKQSACPGDFHGTSGKVPYLPVSHILGLKHNGNMSWVGMGVLGVCQLSSFACGSMHVSVSSCIHYEYKFPHFLLKSTGAYNESLLPQAKTQCKHLYCIESACTRLVQYISSLC